MPDIQLKYEIEVPIGTIAATSVKCLKKLDIAQLRKEIAPK